MNALLSGALADQRHIVDLDGAAQQRVLLDLRRSRSTRTAVTRARVRLSDALARREAQECPQVTVAALAP